MAASRPVKRGPGRFEIRVDPTFRWLFSAVGAGQQHDVILVDPEGLTVRLGWLFRARLPWASVTGARHHPDMVGGWGAHGWAGRWLVNGSSKGIVEVGLDPSQRASLLGFWPLRLRTLYVSLVDPDGFIEVVGDHPGARR